MTQAVLDSGILIASVFAETLTPQATRLLKQLQTDHVTLHAPTLLRYECVAVVRKAVYQNRVTSAEGERIRTTLLAHPLTLHFDVTLLKRGYKLATQLAAGHLLGGNFGDGLEHGIATFRCG